MEGVSSAEHEGICVLQSFFNMKMDRNKPMIIVKNTMETKRQCENLELLYVIRGEMNLVIEKKEYHFQEKGMVVLQPGTWYSWKTGDDEKEILLCKIMMEPYQMQKVMSGNQKIIVCNSVENPNKDYGRIRYIVDSMVNKYIKNETEFVLKSLYYTLWETIKNGFSEEDKTNKEQNKRMQELLQYIQEHYALPLSLKGLAERYYMSDSALSREFKKETGENFVEYLRKIRLQKVSEALTNTDKTISEIAYACGFSDISVLNKNFKKVYGMSPGNYRKSKYAMQMTEQDEGELAEIKEYLLEQDTEKEKEVETGKEKNIISVDVRQYHEVKNPHLNCINAGMAADLLEAKVQRQVRFAVENLHIQYIRISNIFAEEMKLRQGHECENLNFEKMDEIFDFLSDIGAFPFLELPEKQQKYVIDIGSGEKIWNKDVSEIIESREEWECVFERFLQHMIERYTLGTVDQWIFEVADDIECGTGASKNIPYEELYSSTYHLVRKYLPGARIGGCGRNKMMGEEGLKQRLLYWKNSEQYPDFLSFMSYPYKIEPKEKCGEYTLLDMQSDQCFIQKDVEEYRQVLQQLQYPKTPIWITEWNTSLSERNIYNDSCAKACHMLSQMTELFGAVDRMCYWSISDCHARYYDAKAPLVGATGLMTKDGLCKPAYYAYEFWSFVGEKVIAKGKDYVISSRSNHEYNLLLFHPQKFNEAYRARKENEISIEELPYIFENREEKDYTFLLKNLENGRKKISIYRISEEEGNVLSEWKNIGYLDLLNQYEVSYLKKRCVPRMEVIRQEVNNHNLKLHLKLKPNEMCLAFIL